MNVETRKKIRRFFEAIVATLVAFFLVTWKYKEYLDKIMDNRMLEPPKDTTKEAIKKYNEHLNIVVEEVARADAEGMVEKWKARFGKRG